MDFKKSSLTDPNVTKRWIKSHPILTGVIVLVFLVLLISLGKGEKEEINSQIIGTPEERLHMLATEISGIDATYKKIDVEVSDPDRPIDSKMITVGYSVDSIYNKSSLLRNSGELSAEVFKEVYSSYPEAYDVIVQYYSDTVDKYGDTTNEVILVYAIDKTTFQKINWDNFYSGDLCEFLKNESNNYDTVCNVLVNME